jgi:hypothetical protein
MQAWMDQSTAWLAALENGRVVALVNTALMVSNDSAKTWQPWPFSTIPREIVDNCLFCSSGVWTRAAVWVGTSDGQVLKIA